MMAIATVLNGIVNWKAIDEETDKDNNQISFVPLHVLFLIAGPVTIYLLWQGIVATPACMWSWDTPPVKCEWILEYQLAIPDTWNIYTVEIWKYCTAQNQRYSEHIISLYRELAEILKYI